MASLRRHLKAVLPAPQGSRKPLVAYVGAASGDAAWFQKMIGDEVARVGARMKPVKLASPRSKVSTAKGVLEDCNLVFVSGGDVEAGMNVLHERGVLPVFRALAREGRPILGISAGSIMLGRAWVRFAEDGGPPALFPCMGLAPVYVDAHDEEAGWAELRVLLRLVVASGEPRPVGYGLTRQGGIRVEPSDGRVKVVPFGTPAPRFVVRKKRVVVGSRLPVGKAELVAAAKAPPRRRAAPR